MTLRVFVAVDPPGEAVAHLAAVVDSLAVARANRPGHSTRLADRAQWHVTLAFIGDIADSRVERVSTAIDRAVAATTDPITVRIAGGGTFGRGDSTILWAALGEGLVELRALAASVRAQLRRARIPFDRKPWQPHLTISRPGARVAADEVAADVATLAAYEGPAWVVDAVHLVRSEMEQTATGPRPRYTRLSSAPLDPDDRR